MAGPMSPGDNAWAQRPEAANKQSLNKIADNVSQQRAESSMPESRPGQRATKANPVTLSGEDKSKEIEARQAVEKKAYEEDQAKRMAGTNITPIKKELEKVNTEKEELSKEASAVGPTGKYEQTSATASNLLANNKPGYTAIENADKQLTESEKLRNAAAENEELSRNAAMQAEQLSDQSKIGSGIQGERAALEASTIATGAAQEGEAQENYANALDVGDESVNKIGAIYDDYGSKITELDQNEGARLKSMQEKYDEYLVKLGRAANPMTAIGAGLQSLGGFRMGTNDRGNPTLMYDQNATNAANKLAEQRTQLGSEGAKALFDAQLEQAKFYDKENAKVAEQKAANMADMQKNVASTLVGSMSDAANYNEKQQAEAMNQMMNLQKMIAQTGLDINAQKEVAYYLNAAMPALKLKDFVNNTDTDTVMKFARRNLNAGMTPEQQAAALVGVALGGAHDVNELFNPSVTNRQPHAEGGRIKADEVEPGNPDNNDVEDSVPALLAEGEFVISNPDVKKIRNGMGDEVLKKIASYYNGPTKEMATGGQVKAQKSSKRLDPGMTSTWTEQKKVSDDSAKHVGQNMGTGLLSGVGTGATFGPVGAVIGGALGAGIGAIKGAFGMKKAKDDNKLVEEANLINQSSLNDQLLRGVSHGSSNVRT